MFMEMSVRVVGVDTPEIRGAGCGQERIDAYAARDWVRDYLPGREILIDEVEPDKYGGRWDATVYVDGENLARTLIREGLGRPYEGGARGSWCPSPEVP